MKLTTDQHDAILDEFERSTHPRPTDRQRVIDLLTDIAVALDDMGIECRLPLLQSNLAPQDHECLVGHLQTIRDAQFALCELLIDDRAQDSAQRVTWYLAKETCPVCGQPDNCGDCDHTPVDE